MNISYSRVSAYLSCPYSHYLSYEVGVKSKKPHRPLYFGTDFHKLLEVRTDPEKLDKVKQEIVDTYYEIPSQWQSDLGENYLDNLLSIFEDYCSIYKDAPKPNIAEQDFEISMFTHNGEPYVFKGKIDEVYKRKSRETGERYLKIGEHKTFSVRPNLNTLVMNAQKNLYAKAAQVLYGILPKMVIWDYISSRPAAMPVFLEKSGKFSTAKSQNITPFSYLRACNRLGVTDPEILSQAENYNGNISAFFFRVEQDYIPDAVDKVWKGFEYQAHMIAEHGAENQTKNLTRNCAWCSYCDICFAQLNGGSQLDRYMEHDFEVRTRKDIETDERRVKDPYFSNFEIK